MINCVNLSPPVADLRASMKSRERNLARHRRRFHWMQLVWIRFFQPWTGHAHFDVFMFNRQLSINMFIYNERTNKIVPKRDLKKAIKRLLSERSSWMGDQTWIQTRWDFSYAFLDDFLINLLPNVIHFTTYQVLELKWLFRWSSRSIFKENLGRILLPNRNYFSSSMTQSSHLSWFEINFFVSRKIEFRAWITFCDQIKFTDLNKLV